MLDVDDVIAIAEHEWRSIGVIERDRTTLADDLRLELTAARADGVTPERLLGNDIRDFARNLATEAGARRAPHEARRLLLTASAGLVPGVVIGWLLIWQPIIWWPIVDADPIAAAVLRYACSVLAVLIGVLVNVRIRMAGVPAINRTVWLMALLLPIAGLLITPVTMGFASATGYSTAPPIVLIEVAMVAGALTGATLLARRWALAPKLGGRVIGFTS